MKKLLSVFLCLIALMSSLMAAKYHSVPLDNSAYRIIDIAEARGIIEPQIEVRPYNLNKVADLLNEIALSSKVSDGEKEEIERVLSDLNETYGYPETNTLKEVLQNGAYSTAERGNRVKLGLGIESVQTLGRVFGEEGIFDSRNNISGYCMGDLFGFVSFDVNFKVGLDRIDTNAFLPTELKYSTEGFYVDLINRGDRLRSLPDGGFYVGIQAFPEISLDIKDVISMRFGAVERDWGPGKGNLALSSSARVMDGFEIELNPVSWFSYSVMTASLGLASLDSVNGVKWPSENMDDKTGAYNNNLSIHRVEVGPIMGIKLSAWESVVWRKRFELSYLNPLSIYMFSQNSLGDYDNMLMGVDVTFSLGNVGSCYIALGVDELNSFKKPFSCPRNMIAYQAGGKFSVPGGAFSLLTIQGTYIPAFFGAHYESSEKMFGDVKYTTAYVNKGQNIGYPVNPDTLELLVSYETTLKNGYELSFLIKDQLRSAQYAVSSTGTDILTYMNYAAYDSGSGIWGNYESRDFFHNIWNNILDIEIEVTKKLESYPVEFTVALQGMLETSRPFEPEVIPASGDNPEYNPGRVVFTGDWSSVFSGNVRLGINVFY
ncbi:MAG: hypothetical protein ACI4SL_08890 [Candidatus Ornithospirochaeta sp.]